MSDKDAAMQQALEALIDAANVLSAPMFADAVDALKAALEQPVLEQQQVGPVEDMLLRRAVLRSAKIVSGGRFVTKQAALEQPPLPVQPEPLEYWNAVEGWVKIEEVREHFDAVNCGTIYKYGGEGRVPLYTAPPQRQWVGLTVTTILNMMPSTIPADYDGELMEFARAVEAKLKEKNHG